MSSRTLGSPALWGVIAAHLALVVSSRIFGLDLPFPGIPVLILLVITTMHALRRYNLMSYLIFALITFVVSNGYENLSILTGFPFGDYYYSDGLGVKLFLVPWLIAPAYFAAGYFAWSIAHILLGLFGSRARGTDIFLLPMIASFVMVMWDMVMDPVNATIGGNWIWEDGGSYFGVPLSNYLGWLLCVFTIFQLFALYLAWRGPAAEASGSHIRTADKGYWYQAIIPFFAISLASTLYTFVSADALVADPTGQPWHTRDIFESMTLVGVFTVWFVCLLSALLVHRTELKSGQRPPPPR